MIEAYLVGIMEGKLIYLRILTRNYDNIYDNANQILDTNLCVIYAKRVTIQAKDI